MRMLTSPTGLFILRRQMDRLLDRSWEPDLPDLPQMGEWMPPLDVTEGKSGMTLKLDVPGIDPKDVQITLHDQVLTVRGEKKRDDDGKDECFHRVERPYGRFARSVRLPVAVDVKKVTATFKNGVLTIQVAKAVTGSGTTIPIEVGMRILNSPVTLLGSSR